MIDTCATTADLQSKVEKAKEEADIKMIPMDEDSDGKDDGLTFEQVQDEIRAFWRENFKTMLSEYMMEKEKSQTEVVHHKIVCDTCEASPIKGIRYMCSVCADYDICADCERAGKHAEHTLLKIRNPKQAPHKLVCQYKPPGRPNGGFNPLAALNNVDLMQNIGNIDW